MSARYTGEPLLEVSDLHVSFSTYGGHVQAVRGASFTLNQGETLAIVGESGSGKSVTARSIMKLLPKDTAKITSGSIKYKNQELIHHSEKQMRKIRGSELTMIFQDAMTALNPTINIGEQLMEGIRHHQKLSRSDARKKAIQMLKLIGMKDPEVRLKQHLHEFSGGMRQRVMIAIAAIGNPSILIADEPTTALDVTIQAQILDLFKMLQQEIGVSIIIITHDLGVVANLAKRVCVMYAGKIVESGTVRDIFYDPKHPYTEGLLASMPRIDGDKGSPLTSIPGTPPDLFAPPEGCAFAVRCPHAMEVCRSYEPPNVQVGGFDSHYAACWLNDERAKSVLRQKENSHRKELEPVVM
ncbi:ABC transporter ATP-binding protein [Paenibacillus sp. Marseille-Q4541]|uniref:ABC transporter ATP-binding protein n=1 Tax=Paenibacillus sp. Marseille-Q4541 TaxID=2831522 RepID=UPI001BADAD55|nr:ABC transporter ATP-binding protein [Paenibacillus sp. Marseille-Q4541]